MTKHFRKRNYTSESEEENVDIKEQIEDLKFIQKLRVKKTGVDAAVLAIGDSCEFNNNDRLVEKKLNMKSLKENDVLNNFAREKNQSDEDYEMQKFIEEKLKSIKNLGKLDNSQQEAVSEKKVKISDDILFDVSNNLIKNPLKHEYEETIMSEQILSGIPELDLGVVERIRNIEETERALQKLLNDSNKKENKDVSSNYHIVNFVQHKRFDYALINHDCKVKTQIKQLPTVGYAQKKNDHKRPHNSDDYCFERLKKRHEI
jgi:hypothetical protein